MNEHDLDLIRRYYQEQLSDREIEQLENDLQDSEELRRAFVNMSVVETQLRNLSIESKAEETIPTTSSTKQPWIAYLALAASILISLGLLIFFTRDHSIATLKSSEYASWESQLPTLPGSDLDRGEMFLKEGLATIVFNSGAEMSVEGPTRFSLVSSMEAKIKSGTVTVYAPESAKGFKLHTPYGDAIDHGTEFTVKVSDVEQRSSFWVNEGEISVHSDDGSSFHLKDREHKSLGVSENLPIDPLKEGSFEQSEQQALVYSPQGFEKSIIVMNDIKNRIDPELLMVKNQKIKNNVNRKTFFAFHIPHKTRTSIEEASLTLNYVPSGRGTIAGMPKESTFLLYAFSNEFKAAWPQNLTYWEDSPSFQNAKVVAKFSIPRAQLRKTITLNTPELKEYLKSHPLDKLSFSIVCETKGATYVHGFASSLHPEASGPLLKLHLPEMM